MSPHVLGQATSLGNAFVGIPQLLEAGNTAVGQMLESRVGGPLVTWLRGPAVPRSMPSSCDVARNAKVKTTGISKDPDVQGTRSFEHLCSSRRSLFDI